MRYYPIFLDLRSRKVLVVGAGRVAERKVRSLVRAGAQVTVVAPQATAGLRKLAAAGNVRWRARRFRASDLGGALLVFSATHSPEVERQVAAEAARRGILANCAGEPERGSFIVPAQMIRGNLQIAISTAGASPALARKLAGQLGKQFGPEYAEWTRLLARLRPRILRSVPANERPALFERLASETFLRLLRREGSRRAAERIKAVMSEKGSQETGVRS